MALGLLLDTHALVWGQLERKKLTSRARKAVDVASRVYVSSITFLAMAQKARPGKWPGIEPFMHRFAAIHEQQGGHIVDVDREMASSAGELIWSHRDPFDRIIAATALKRKLLLISADSVFDDVLNRIWCSLSSADGHHPPRSRQLQQKRFRLETVAPRPRA